jgi:hypothetical protein
MAANLLDNLEGIEVPAPQNGAFDDVAGTAHQAAIETLAAYDPPIVAGDGQGSFEPDGEVTRGQFAAILARLLDEVAGQTDGLEPLPAGTARFSDAADSVHQPAISQLSGVGVIGGYPDDTFRPRSSITRGQAATLLAGAMGGMADVGLLTPPEPVAAPDLDVSVQ